MRHYWKPFVLLCLTCGLCIGCGVQSTAVVAKPARYTSSQGASAVHLGAMTPDGLIDAEKVRHADYSILFVGNSHTMMHDLPTLVCRMIEFRHPGKKVCGNYYSVGFLEDTAADDRLKGDIAAHPWKFVVLQAQKISMSGTRDYSRTEGIDLAKHAKEHGAQVLYFAEWSRKGVAEEGPRTERIYRAMAEAAAARVSPIGRAWDLALAERPDLPLHSGDGNHQSAVGAFLTGCMLYASITGESPAELAAFPYESVSDSDRKFLAEVAARCAKEAASKAP